MPPEAVEAGERRLAGRQGVALDFHVEEELRDDAEERAPQQHQPDLRGDERPQDELAGRQAHAAGDDARGRRAASSCAAAPASRELRAAEDESSP